MPLAGLLITGVFCLRGTPVFTCLRAAFCRSGAPDMRDGMDNRTKTDLESRRRRLEREAEKLEEIPEPVMYPEVDPKGAFQDDWSLYPEGFDV